MKKRPHHVKMNQFLVENKQLQVGGIPITQLAARVGQTPFYAYDRELISQRVDRLRKILPEGIHLHYAIKANPMPAVVQHLSKLTDGLDVASLGEMHVGLNCGIAPEKISFAGPGKSHTELKAAVAAGVIVNLESEGEMERIAEQGQQLSLQPRVSVRVNPDFELKKSGMKMGGGPKPFGVDAERVPAMLKRLKELELDYQGFHIFSGSQNLRPEAIIEAQNNTFELALRLEDYAPSPTLSLNIGGGFGIPYFAGETHLELEPIADNLDKLLTNYKPKFPEAEIVIELGRYLVAHAGVYICEVIDRKESRGELFLITNGGLHQHLAASGNFGQIIRKNYPAAIANKMGEDKTEQANIVGPLCTPLDILSLRENLPPTYPGDLVVIFQSGAYGFTASPLQFLGHPAPLEILV